MYITITHNKRQLPININAIMRLSEIVHYEFWGDTIKSELYYLDGHKIMIQYTIYEIEEMIINKLNND